MATNISIPTYGFVNHILALNEGNWRTFFKPFITDSVQNGLATIAGANMTVYVSAGECRCGAVMGILDEMIALDVANGDSTYNRIDSVVVQYTYGEPSTLAVAIVQGTPSANPVPPTLTKVYDTLWQMEIAQILVPSGATSSSEFTITDKRIIYESIESIINDNTESEERVWSSQKTHEEIVSLSTEIYDSLNTKADAITRTASGSLVHITDAGAYPVDSLSVSIEPVQDLHGYDAPWPGGAVANLVEDMITGNIESNGTVSSTDFKLAIAKVTQGETYVISRNGQNDITSGTVVCGYFTSFPEVGSTTYNNSRETAGLNPFTAPITGYVAVRFNSNAAEKTQIEKGSTITAYSPYSNVCPISGHSSAVVTRTGINIWDEEWEVGGIDGITGQNTNANDRIRSKSYTAVKPGTVFRIVTTNTMYFRFYDVNKAYIGGQNVANGGTLTIPSGVFYMRFNLVYATPTEYKYDLSINYPDTVTTYQASHVQTVTIDLDGTRYGGSIDVLTGEMTLDRANVTYTGAQSESWSFATYGHNNANRMAITISDAKKGGNNPILGNYFKNCETIGIEYAKPWEGNTNTNGALLLYVPDTFTDADTWKSYLASNNLQIVYYLNQPVTVTLSPATLSLLLGENNIWADTGDILNLTYPVGSSKSFIDKQIAESQIKTRQMITIVTDQMVAPNNLNINDIIVVNDDLYKVINSNIASGEAMVIGTNVIKITLAEYIQSML